MNNNNEINNKHNDEHLLKIWTPFEQYYFEFQ